MSRVLMVLCVMLSAVGWARADEPDPAAILKAADQALWGGEAHAFEVRAWGVGARGPRTPEVTARVALRRAGERAEFPWLFRVEGSASWSDAARRDAVGKDGNPAALPKERAEFVTSFDGQVVRTLRTSEELVFEGPWTAREVAMREGAGVALTWLTRWRGLIGEPFGGEEPKLRARWEGQGTVDGVLCDVVYVDYSESADPVLFEGWWWLARGDRLPRRVELNLRESAGDGFLVMMVKPAQSEVPAAEGFALVAPAGWPIAKADAPAPRRAARRAPGPQVGEIAPDFTLEDPSGTLHSLADYRGKVVLLDFWATWCGPCREAMPVMQELHEKFGEKGLVVIGMNAWESGDPVAFKKEHEYTYLLLLKADEIATTYGVRGIPQFYLIGPDGKVVQSVTGFNRRALEGLGEKIESILPKSP